MFIEQQVAVIPPVSNFSQYSCHVATWYWAARAAQHAGKSEAKSPDVTIKTIAAMSLPPQPAILALPRSGSWDFSITPTCPPVGSVLVWTGDGTHSAVVTGPNTISGYGQSAQFLNLLGQRGLTTASPAQLGAAYKKCFVVNELDIINRAGALNL